MPRRCTGAAAPAALRAYDAFVLPGGFAYEDRVRAGAVAAHDEAMDAVAAAAQAGKFVVGICNGAQILLESGLVPGTGPLRRPTAAFAPNASGRFASLHVYVRLAVPPARVPVLGALPPNAFSRRGRRMPKAVSPPIRRRARSARARRPHRVRLLRRARRTVPAPNGSARGAAALTNRAGTSRDHAAPRARRVDVHAPRRRRRDGRGPRKRARDARALGRDPLFRGVRGRARRRRARR